MKHTMENPPAFPQPKGRGEDAIKYGMTLRDYFAAKAMQAIIIKKGTPTDYHWGNGTEDQKPELAKRAYGIADALLSHRQPKP